MREIAHLLLDWTPFWQAGIAAVVVFTALMIESKRVDVLGDEDDPTSGREFADRETAKVHSSLTCSRSEDVASLDEAYARVVLGYGDSHLGWKEIQDAELGF